MLLRVLAVSATILAASPCFATDRYVAFGDSLSDNGNLPAIGAPAPPPPYAGGRFSNGPTFVEDLAGPMAHFALTPVDNATSVNFAFGGARTDSVGNTNGPIPGSDQQIQTYLALGGQFAARDVVTLWAGANNLFQAITAQITSGAIINDPAAAVANVKAAAASAVSDLAQQIGVLLAAGAHRIVVFDLPDFAAIPQFGHAPDGLKALAGAASASFDADLATTLAGLHNSHLLPVDIAGLFADALAHPATYGFTNVTDACTAVLACVLGSQADQDRYLFWDAVHPTAAGHRVIADLVRSDLIAAGVPEPSTWGLMLLGSAGLVFVARRRRRAAALG